MIVTTEMTEYNYTGQLIIPENIFESKSFKNLWAKLLSKNNERLTIDDDKVFHIQGEIKGSFSKGFEDLLNQRVAEEISPENAEIQYSVKEYVGPKSKQLSAEKGNIKIDASGFTVKCIEIRSSKVVAPAADIRPIKKKK